MPSQLATDITPTAPLKSTPEAARFVTYWRKYRDEIDEIAARARRIALKDGRAVVCKNDLEAAWTQVIGKLWAHGMKGRYEEEA